MTMGRHDHIISKYRHRFFDERMKPLQINPPESAYLVKINEKQIVKMSDLNQMLPFHKSHATRSIQALVEYGYITKETDPEDQRGYIVAITETGKNIAMQVKAIFSAWDELIKSSLTEEDIQMIERIQERMVSRLQEYFQEEPIDEKNL